MTPDFSPKMLAMFLEGRVQIRVAEFAVSRKAAKRYMRQDLAHITGLDESAISLAMAGQLKAKEPRTKIWAALEIYPAFYRVLLTDDGGQEVIDISMMEKAA